MTLSPLSLASEFPGQDQTFLRLNQTDPTFSRLATAYHNVKRAEAASEDLTDQEIGELRQEKIRLKTKIQRRLQE